MCRARLVELCEHVLMDYCHYITQVANRRAWSMLTAKTAAEHVPCELKGVYNLSVLCKPLCTVRVLHTFAIVYRKGVLCRVGYQDVRIAQWVLEQWVFREFTNSTFFLIIIDWSEATNAGQQWPSTVLKRIKWLETIKSPCFVCAPVPPTDSSSN
jgi:hypothetical protein